MLSYLCKDCQNVSGYAHTSKGLCCRDCLSYNVAVLVVEDDSNVYIPITEPMQIKELERIAALVDERGESTCGYGWGV